MSHRVIAGSAKGRRLKQVPGDGTRPIMDRAKEALFNIIGRDIYDAYFLDLFAGTGSVGIEALSRGAEFAEFLDLSRQAIIVIHDNLKTTNLAQQARVLRKDAFVHLAENPKDIYDFIYVAPPQYQSLWQKTLLALESNPSWLAEDTRVIVQIDPKEKEELTLKYLVPIDERRYGNTLLWFWETQALPDDEDK